MIKIALPLVKYFKILNHNLVKSYLDKNLRKPGLACSELKHLLPNVDFFKGWHPSGVHLKYICIKPHISTYK